MMLRVGGYVALAAATLSSGVGFASVLTEGTCGTYSPDGTKVAFQRVVGGRSRVGVFSRESGSMAWVETAGNAAQPAWNRSGDALVYAFGNETNSAFVAQHGDTGYHLRVWRRKEGIRELTTGRFRDSMPAFAPDGTSVFFASTRCTQEGDFPMDVRSALYSVPTVGGTPVCLIRNESPESGFGQPVPSPDGHFIAFAWLPHFLSSWCIVCVRADDWNDRRLLTPANQCAYAPRWSPDGRFVVYTGFSKGDCGWGVYVLDTRTGASRRICDGRNPDVHPSGQFLLFDDGRNLIERPLAASDMPHGVTTMRTGCQPERVIWSARSPTCPLHVPMDESFAFGSNTTFFLRTKIRFSSADEPRFRYLMSGSYLDTPPHYEMCFEFLLDRGIPQFGLRHASGLYAGVEWTDRLEEGKTYVITGIRDGNTIYIHLDGKNPIARRMSSFMPLRAPDKLSVGRTYAVPDGILSAEVGTGWPTNVPDQRDLGVFFGAGEGEPL